MKPILVLEIPQKYMRKLVSIIEIMIVLEVMLLLKLTIEKHII